MGCMSFYCYSPPLQNWQFKQTRSVTLISGSQVVGAAGRLEMSSNSPLSLGQEKEDRTAEQKKIDSQLLYAIYQLRGEAQAKGTPTEPIPLERDAKGRVLVDVRAVVSKKLVS